MKLLVRAVLPVAAGALLLAGCTDTRTGTPSAAGSATSAPSTGESSSADPGGATTTSLEPCTLLTAADVAAYGTFKDGEEQKLGSARVCRYQKQRTDASEEGGIIGVAIRDDAPLASVNDTGGGIKDLEVNGRKAKQASSQSPLGCTVALGVGDNARVDVNVTAVDTVEKACQMANDVATKAVEPKLPKA
ncbi:MULTISPECIES: DUF3558 domain-containing protein [Amycolatopsis]|uniref:DUF3558 domain-containing protein n=1 Tax=Amycolatopsis bullii TaxID=941987 RepID=A0ABQ3K7U7_9PSEU|nr:DUF3558 domain-containing protein [Amycolatopsis bullii]GHG05781.1 hypothetical protein GCM10017567_22570 [Amycolatopsis bullii]